LGKKRRKRNEENALKIPLQRKFRKIKRDGEKRNPALEKKPQ